MRYFITPDGSYYEAINDEVAVGSIEVPKRPDRSYKWTGTEWIVDQEFIKAQIRVEIKEAEQKEMLPHGVRVFMLTALENEAMEKFSLTRPQAQAALMIGNSGYRRVKEFHDFISAKEALL